jgi:aryl-alcohol dehydrogenase-like predicted oxidoreductase
MSAHPALGGIPLVFGGNVFGWTLDRDRSFAVLDAFYELGGRMIDSAEGYSSWIPGNVGGESETIIGEWQESRGVRKDMLITTKTGMGGPPYALKPENVEKAIAGSLERLRTDYVDLYYAHRDDMTTPLDEVVDAYDAVLQSGRARELAASNYTTERLAEIIAVAERKGKAHYTVLQPKYNLIWRHEFEGPLQDLCLAKGVAVTPYYGLASGFLSGKFRKAADWEGSSRAFPLSEFAENGGWAMLDVMDDVARETGATCAQIALAWLLRQPAVAAPLASATSAAQLADLVAGVTLWLEDEQVARLTAGFSQAAVQSRA